MRLRLRWRQRRLRPGRRRHHAGLRLLRLLLLWVMVWMVWMMLVVWVVLLRRVVLQGVVVVG